jgi:mono/diheme cytochrome c family protein
MKQGMMTSTGVRVLMLCVVCGLLLEPRLAATAEDQSSAAANGASQGITDAEKTEAKAIFAAQCSWCHGSYGMAPDKGPRLAGTQMTEREVQERIRDGKPGFMPSFHRFLDDEQIALMAKYIKSLVPPS